MAGTDILHASSVSPKVLYSQQIGTTADAAVYTVNAGESVKLWKAVACNTTGSPATLFVGVVKAGDSGAASHRVISGFSLPAGDSISLDDYLAGIGLGPGDFITAHSGTATAVNLTLSGSVHA